MSTVTGAVPACRTTRSVPAAPERSTTASTACGADRKSEGERRGKNGQAEQRRQDAAPRSSHLHLRTPLGATASVERTSSRIYPPPVVTQSSAPHPIRWSVPGSRGERRRTAQNSAPYGNSGTRSNKDLADRDIDHANVDTGPSERRMQLVPLSPGGRVTAVATAPLPPGPLQVALRVSGEAVVIEALGPLGPTQVGRLSAADSAAYRPVLSRLAARGHTGTCPALAARTGDAATLTLHLGPPATCVPHEAPCAAPGGPRQRTSARPRADGPARRGRSGGPLSCAAPIPPRHRPRPRAAAPVDRVEERGAAPAAVRTAPPIPAAGPPTRPVRATRRPRTPAHPQPAAPGALGDRGPRRRAAARVGDAEQHRHLGPPRRGDGPGHLPPRRHRELPGRAALRSPVPRVLNDVR